LHVEIMGKAGVFIARSLFRKLMTREFLVLFFIVSSFWVRK